MVIGDCECCQFGKNLYTNESNMINYAVLEKSGYILCEIRKKALRNYQRKCMFFRPYQSGYKDITN